MEITTYKEDCLPDMAELFIDNFRKLRSSIPALPDLMEDTDRVVAMLANLFKGCPGVVALEDSKLMGYMGWFVVDHFRETEWTAAYCPEWGHAASQDWKQEIYRAMYRGAAQCWTDSGCQVHALTLLAHDYEAEKAWFWNGFGLGIIDAVRSTRRLDNATLHNIRVRKATQDDAEQIHELEVEHWCHYGQPPILMRANHPADTETLAQFVGKPHNSLWVALDGDNYAGYLRFEANNSDSVAIVAAPDVISNTGAYVRPQYRGRGIATAMLDEALHHYAAQGFRRCSVDFESFNPTAVAFWLRYFDPVCFSLMRVPEKYWVFQK